MKSVFKTLDRNLRTYNELPKDYQFMAAKNGFLWAGLHGT